MADNGAIKVAYLAYRQWMKDSKVIEKSLPGLERYLPRQMFWLNYAQMCCAIERRSKIVYYIVYFAYQHVNFTGRLKDPHAPHPLRALVPLMNSDEFAADFSCAPQTNMNPQNKCRIW